MGSLAGALSRVAVGAAAGAVAVWAAEAARQKLVSILLKGTTFKKNAKNSSQDIVKAL